MKIGGFKTPEELEAYGEDNFFRDYPEARKMAMGGTPEAFNMSMPADKFFSYGVPVPPTYYAEGGSLDNRMVYPQIQSADQFFSPVYSNSHNAYARGGNIEEFPQAISYPQHGWGKTNYFMLQDGGTFPPGMPQYTGMLPVMQTGSGLSGILTKTVEDSDHYGVPAFQDGGTADDEPDQSFYANKMNQFMDKIRGTAYQKMSEDLMSSANPYIEEMPEPGAKYGGYPLAKAQFGPPSAQDRYAASVKKQQDDFRARVEEQAAFQKWADEERFKKRHAGLTARQWQSIQDLTQKPANQPAKSSTETTPKKSTETQSGVSKTVQPSTQKTVQPTGPTASTTSTSNPPAAANTGNNTGTKTTTSETTSSAPPGWKKVIVNGVEGYINPETNQFYTPYAGNYNYPTYGYDPMWVMPGRYRPGRITEGMDAYLQALAAGQIARGEVKLQGPVDTRRAIMPGNRIKSMTFVVPGSGSPMPNQNYYIDKPGKKTGKLRQFFSGNKNKEVVNPTLSVSSDYTGRPKKEDIIQPEDYDPRIKQAMAQNFRSGQGSFAPSGGWQEFPGTMEKTPVGPVNPDYATAAVINSSNQGPITFDKTNPEHRKVIMKAILDSLPEQAYGGPFALPMYVVGGPGMETMGQQNPDTLKAIQFQPDDEQDEIMNPVGYQKEDKPFTPEEAAKILGDEHEMGPDKKFKYKPGRQKKANLGPDAIMAMEAFGTNLMNKMPWNKDTQNFNSALSVYGMPRKPTNRGSYLTNDPGVGNTFRPNQYNPNMRGFYAPDFGYAQTGGQQFANMDGDQYYLTQEQINKVIKAGGRVPGF